VNRARKPIQLRDGHVEGCGACRGGKDWAVPLEPAWRAYSPFDPDLDPELRAQHEATPQPEPIGEVHVFVHSLEDGHSEVRVGPSADALSVDGLLEAAIRELQTARRIFVQEQ